MRSLMIALALVLCGLSGRTQQIVDVSTNAFDATIHSDVVSNVMGQIYQPTKYVKVTSGSPFFKDQYMKARLIDDKGDSYASNAVRLNLVDNQINFLDADGTERVTITLIKAVRFTDSVSGSQYMFVLGEDVPKAEKSQAKTWFQILVNDTVSLCRQIKKSIHESIGYGTSTTEEEIVTADLYFVQIKGVFSRVKTWADLIQLFSDKKDPIDQYVHDHHLKGKSVEDYTQLVQFYNSLKNV
jgi:hypothetical protein